MKQRYKFILIFIVLISISIVSAAYSEELTITGEGYIRVDKDIRVTNIKLAGTTGQAYEEYNSKYTQNTTSMFVVLPRGSTITYDVEITNKANVDFLIKSIKQISHTNPNVEIIIDIKENDIIEKTSKKNFSITIKNNTEEEQKETLVYEYLFRENKFLVTLDANGGEVSPSTKEVSYKSTYEDLPTPKREGYIFKGWELNLMNYVNFEDNHGVRSYGEGELGEYIHYEGYMATPDLIPIEGGITLYSNIEVCGIYSYDKDGNFIKRESSYTKEHHISENAKYIRIEINKDKDNQTLDYYKNNLIISQKVTNGNQVNIADDHTLKAQWVKEHKVTFDYNYLENNIFEQHYNATQVTPCCTGNKLISFNKDDFGNYKIVTNVVNSNITSSNGFYFPNKKSLLSGEKYTYQIEVKMSEETIGNIGIENGGFFSGYNFPKDKWIRVTKTFEAISQGYQAFIIYPVFAATSEEREIYLRNIYLSKTNTLNIKNYNIEDGKTLGDSYINPARDGYTFSGWYTEPINEYGDKVTENTLVTSDITYYAHWSKNS